MLGKAVRVTCRPARVVKVDGLEYAWHVSHADLIRESVDGLTGGGSAGLTAHPGAGLTAHPGRRLRRCRRARKLGWQRWSCGGRFPVRGSAGGSAEPRGDRTVAEGERATASDPPAAYRADRGRPAAEHLPRVRLRGAFRHAGPAAGGPGRWPGHA